MDPQKFCPEFKNKPVRSFVVRGGRMTEGQRRALSRHWDTYRLSLFADALTSWQEVFGREAPVVLEIGFGMGDSLLEMVENEPDKDFVGIEVYPPGAGRLVNRAAERGLTNLRIYLADATDVLVDCIPDQSLHRVQLYFPDPWHKKKHHKRRIVQSPFIGLIAAKLQPRGLFHLATDWENYAEQMVEVMGSAAEFSNEAAVPAECPFVPRPAFRPETKFERRGLNLGHGVWDLLYRRLL